ncbi:hypothetical protein KAW65_00440 [candidate division WOR-3 bacterium]|nr:hypothetical protein [candidate division WOR-3 bacterium]
MRVKNHREMRNNKDIEKTKHSAINTGRNTGRLHYSLHYPWKEVVSNQNSFKPIESFPIGDLVVTKRGHEVKIISRSNNHITIKVLVNNKELECPLWMLVKPWKNS